VSTPLVLNRACPRATAMSFSGSSMVVREIQRPPETATPPVIRPRISTASNTSDNGSPTMSAL